MKNKINKILKTINTNKTKFCIASLLIIMTIGYAAINTNLKFNGLAFFRSSGDDFSVYISRAFINGKGSSKYINSDKNSIIFSYSDINDSETATIDYSVKNTSKLYDADVEVVCTQKYVDNTTFLYGENGLTSEKFRVDAGRSKNSIITVKLPDANNDTVQNKNLYEFVKSKSQGLDTNIDFNSTSSNGVFETKKTNSGKSVYFYRGDIKDNHVIFANKCWLISRTIDTGGVKLIYNGIPMNGTCLPLGASLSIDGDDISLSGNTVHSDNAYIGYMYGKVPSTSYNEAHTNTNDSLMKTELDKWYENNILGTGFESYILDTVWCNDRSILSDFSSITYTGTPTTLGYGTEYTYYGSAARSSALAKNLSPSFICDNNNDRFSISTNIGNGKLKYPISSMRADELVFAGATKSNNSNFWLYTNGKNILTTSPIGFYNNTTNYISEDTNGKLSSFPNNNSNDKFYVLPAISVNDEIGIIRGSGVNTDPFILSSEDVYHNEYKCALNITAIGRTEIGEGGNLGEDLQVGEEYCIGEECFYVISNDGNGTIKLFSKYNLYVGRIYNSASSYTTIDKTDPLYGKQNIVAEGYPISGGYPRIGTTSFGNSNSYASSIPKNYVDEYVDYLKKTYNVNVEGSLITYDELTSLGCTNSCQNAKFDWVAGRSYWTATPATSGKIYIVGADGFFNSTSGITNSDNRGIRPVITINLKNTNSIIKFVTGTGKNVGDEICIGEECFNVINYDGANYTLFAKNNLYVGRKYTSSSSYTDISTTDPLYGKQNPIAKGDAASPWIGGIQYHASSNSYATSNAKTYVDEYVTYLNNLANINVSGRLITKEELLSLGCLDDGNIRCKQATYDWVVGGQTYWVGTPGTDINRIYLVGGDGFFGASAVSNQGQRGVRPIIILSSSDIYTGVPYEWQDNGIFSEYYDQAYSKMKGLTTEEKVGQLLLARYPTDSTAVSEANTYHLGGYVLFGKDFTNKTKTQVQNITSNIQNGRAIPLITAVDEEGGKVVRISSNTNLRSTPFKSSQDLYNEGGLELIKSDTIEKSNLLKELGLNVNLAPVLDISSSSSYIYPRTLGQPASITAQFANTVINTSKNSGVSYTLKHFPGYGDNLDTHGTESIDTRTYDELMSKDIVPFKSAIENGAEAVLISHNTVTSIDSANPASISKAMHNLLFSNLHFTGISMTDDLSMGATLNISGRYKKAVEAGNHLLIVTNYKDAYNEILDAVYNGEISQATLEKSVFKIIAWKYYKGLLK